MLQHSTAAPSCVSATVTWLWHPSLRVQEQTGDQDDDNGQELQKAHANQRVSEEILLHGWVACHAHHQSCEQLPNALSTATNGHHGNGTAWVLVNELNLRYHNRDRWYVNGFLILVLFLVP